MGGVVISLSGETLVLSFNFCERWEMRRHENSMSLPASPKSFSQFSENVFVFLSHPARPEGFLIFFFYMRFSLKSLHQPGGCLVLALTRANDPLICLSLIVLFRLMNWVSPSLSGSGRCDLRFAIQAGLEPPGLKRMDNFMMALYHHQLLLTCDGPPGWQNYCLRFLFSHTFDLLMV